jgi:putative methionine-R-sulfoxide reductase with GAF domain
MTVKMTSLEKVSCKLTYALRFKKLVNAIHSAPDFHTVLIGLQTEIIKLYESQMVTIYLVDSERQELYSQALLSANKLKEIRIPIDGNSIAGYVAQTGNIVNIKNVHDKMELINIDADLSFDNAWDEKSGMKTKQVLAVPVLFQRKLLGVIQLINKKNGRHFTVEDQKHLFDLTETLGIAFHNLRKGTRKAPTRYDMLIKNGIISEADLVAAQTSARKDQKDVETVLIHDFKVSRQEMGTALSLFYDKPFVNLQHAVYNPIARVSGINIEYFRKTKCIPLLEKNGSSIFAVDNPLDQVKIQEVMRLLRVSTVDCHVALKEDIENFINLQKSTTTHHSKAGKEKSLKDILAEMRQHAEIIASPEEEVESSAVDDRAIVLLVKKIIEDAYKHRASDIHLEPNGSKRDAEVRFRIDGRCGKFLTIPKTHIKAVVSRLKILSKLDIA